MDTRLYRLAPLVVLAFAVSGIGVAVASTPTITSISPDRGAVGADVTITGSGFSEVTSVSFGTVAASFTIDSDTQIATTVPSGATTGPIRITDNQEMATTPAFTVQPNIVLILTDDQRTDETSFMPTLNSEIARRGVTFKHGFVVDPLCCPSRTTILTGKYSHSTDIYRNNPPHGGFQTFLDRGEEDSTIATWLQSVGYDTALVGKYLNGYGPGQTSHVPPGWSTWDALAAPGTGGYYNYWMSLNGTAAYYGQAPEDYSTHVLAADAVDFIHAAPPATPLFLYFAPKAPHTPDTAPPEYLHACAGLSIPTPPSYDEADVSDKPAYIQNLPRLGGKQISHRKQCRSLLAVDDGIKEILGALEVTGRLTDSLIVFMSDNGVELGEHRWRSKQVPYESSINVPFMMRYDSLRAGLPPAVNDRLVLNVDLAPTFADAGGASAPGAEGTSLLPLLSGTATSWRTAFPVEHMGVNVPSYCAVRSEHYMYVEYKTGEQELYDLVNDPYELQNQAANPNPPYPDELASMHARMLNLCDPPPPGFTP